MKEFLNKLNGWQRLFVAFLVFAYIPFAVLIISDVYYNDWKNIDAFSGQMSKELSDSMDRNETILKYSKDGIEWDLMVSENYLMNIVGSQDDDWTYRIFVSKKLGADKLNQYSKEMNGLIRTHIFKFKLKERALLTLYFTLGAVGIYLFGWTLGWIYRGFRKQP